MSEKESLPQLSDLQQRLLTLREMKAGLDKNIKELNAEIDGVEGEVIDAMKAAGLTSFKSELGSVSITTKWSVRLPAGTEQMEQFWGYCKERGCYDALRTVNSQRLNSWYREELEAAKAKGDVDFCVPGIEEPKPYETLSVRRG